MAHGAAEVLRLLRSSLCDQTELRLAGESGLSARELQPGCLAALFAITARHDASVESHVRLAAAVYFKNLVRREWDRATLHAPDTALVREGLVEALVAAPTRVQSQLAEALKRVISADFPPAYPTLLPAILANLTSSQLDRVEAGLCALRCLAKVYEFKGVANAGKSPVVPLNDETLDLLASPEGLDAAHAAHRDQYLQYLHTNTRAALDHTVAATFPTLLAIMRRAESSIDEQMRGIAPLSIKPHEIQRTVCKIVWSCTQCALPPYLVDDLPGVFSDWMDAFLTALRRPVVGQLHPSEEALDEDTLRRFPQWKVKQWIGHVVHRLFQRYSDPSRLNSSGFKNHDMNSAAKFAAFFRVTYAGPFTSAMLEVLSWDQGRISSRVANLALVYLETAIAPGVTYRIVKPQLEVLLTNVIFPYMCMNDTDLKLWAEDPVEYVRKSYDILEDFFTPRAGACSLLFIMSKLRPAHTVAPFLGFLMQVLDAYAGASALESDDLATQQHRATLARQKDGALLALGTIRESLVATPENRLQLENVLRVHVLPDFQSSFPYLRARACWLFGQLTASESISVNSMLSGLEGVHMCLHDSEFPVRVRAAVDIRHFLSNRVMADNIGPRLSDVLTQLFALLQDIDNTDIVHSIDQVVVGFSDQIAPFAGPFCARLVETFTRAASAGQDDDEAGFAAAQCIQALESIVTSVALSSLPKKIEVFAEMEQTFSVIFDRMFGEDRMEYFEESLELLSTFVYYSAEERGAHIREQHANGQQFNPLVMGTVVRSGETSGNGATRTKELDDVMLTSAIAGEGLISLYLWSLFPSAMYAFQDWATDYSFHYMHPVDSYLSKGARVFLALRDKDTTYTQMLIKMVSSLWDESYLDIDEYALQGSRITALFLQHCRDASDVSIDSDVAALTQYAVMRLRANSASHPAVSALLRSLAHLLFVSPLVTLTVLDKSMGCTAEVFRLWMCMVQQRRFDSKYDRKASAVALTSILGADWSLLPPSLHNSMPQVLVMIVTLLEELECAARADDRHNAASGDHEGGLNTDEARRAAYIANGGLSNKGSTVADEDGDVDPSVRIKSCLDEAGLRVMCSVEADLKHLSSINTRLGKEDGDSDNADDSDEVLEDGENQMFCLLQDVDELLFFDKVVRRLSPQASQSLTMALAADDTRRIQGALHRAAELRRIPKPQHA